MNKLLISIVLIAISTAVSAAPTDGEGGKGCPDELRTKADESFGRLVLYGDYNIKWPSNEQELKALCDLYKPNEQVVRKFIKKCTIGLPQQVLSLVLKGAASMVKRFCKNGGDKSVFQYSACGNSDPVHDHNCMHKYVQNTKNSITMDEEKRLAGACCSYNEFEDCIVNRLRKEEKCSSDAIVFFKRQIKSIAGDALDLTCSEYKANPKLCGPVMKKMKPSKQEGKSLLLPLVRVMESLA